MSREYTHLYRQKLDYNAKWDCQWDIFISAYNASERVRGVFDKIEATKKYWIAHEEYGFGEEELPPKYILVDGSSGEMGMLGVWNSVTAGRGDDWRDMCLCIDATGFLRPHLMFLLKLLLSKGVKKFDVLYSEPEYYKKKDRTMFSGSHVEEVRQVAGFEGIHDNAGSREVLIIGAGYETHLISEVAEDKDQARKVVLLGLPSLRPDMYQQNVWRTWQAEDAIDPESSERYFVPASDPFATATVVSELIDRERKRGDLRHIYLAPLSTKAQAVGFALCHLVEHEGANVSIIYPFTKDYEKETSIGIARIWRNTLEL